MVDMIGDHWSQFVVLYSYLIQVCTRLFHAMSYCLPVVHRIKVVDAMAEPVKLDSGVSTSVASTLESTTILYKTITNFKFIPKEVRELLQELADLTEALKALSEVVGCITDAYLFLLGLPLEKCANACKEFEGRITNHSQHFSISQMKRQDWACLTYMYGNIADFRRLLAGYKLTIIVILTNQKQ